MNLGRRVKYLREKRRDQIMPNNDIEKLDAIGFVDVRGWQWQRVLKSLHVYKELHGDLEALSDFVVPSEAPWPEDAWGMKLGNRGGQHPQPGDLPRGPTDRVAELNRMGFIWDVYEEHWQRILDSLHVYKELHGDLEVPQEFAVPSESAVARGRVGHATSATSVWPASATRRDVRQGPAGPGRGAEPHRVYLGFL